MNLQASAANMQKAKRRRRSSRKELVSWALASALLCLLVAGYDAHEMAGRRASTTSARETLQSQRRKQTMRPATDADSFNASGDMAFARRQIKIAPTAAAAAATKNNEEAADSAPRLVHSEANATTVVMLGEPHMIWCPIEAQPEPEVKWFKDARELIDDDVSTQTQQAHATHRDMSGKELMFMSVHEDDAGEYRCEATNYLGTVRSERMRLSVKSTVRDTRVHLELVAGPASAHPQSRLTLLCSLPVRVPAAEVAAAATADATEATDAGVERPLSWRRNGKRLTVEWVDAEFAKQPLAAGSANDAHEPNANLVARQMSPQQFSLSLPQQQQQQFEQPDEYTCALDPSALLTESAPLKPEAADDSQAAEASGAWESLAHESNTVLLPQQQQQHNKQQPVSIDIQLAKPIDNLVDSILSNATQHNKTQVQITQLAEPSATPNGVAWILQQLTQVLIVMSTNPGLQVLEVLVVGALVSLCWRCCLCASECARAKRSNARIKNAARQMYLNQRTVERQLRYHESVKRQLSLLLGSQQTSSAADASAAHISATRSRDDLVGKGARDSTDATLLAAGFLSAASCEQLNAAALAAATDRGWALRASARHRVAAAETDANAAVPSTPLYDADEQRNLLQVCAPMQSLRDINNPAANAHSNIAAQTMFQQSRGPQRQDYKLQAMQLQRQLIQQQQQQQQHNLDNDVEQASIYYVPNQCAMPSRHALSYQREPSNHYSTIGTGVDGGEAYGEQEDMYEELDLRSSLIHNSRAASDKTLAVSGQRQQQPLPPPSAAAAEEDLRALRISTFMNGPQQDAAANVLARANRSAAAALQQHTNVDIPHTDSFVYSASSSSGCGGSNSTSAASSSASFVRKAFDWLRTSRRRKSIGSAYAAAYAAAAASASHTHVRTLSSRVPKAAAQ